MAKNASDIADIYRASFLRDGYVVLRDFAESSTCDALRSIAIDHDRGQIAPIEYEVDVAYPGAPSADAEGSDTPRRLLQAYARGAEFRQWATSSALKDILKALYGSGEDVMVSQCHHNCVMTKAPGYSSATLWHQDNRYWSFDREDLISAWLALGDENKTNGCLRVIPGSHTLDLAPGRFDAALFLRPDLPENKTLIATSVPVELAKGDLLLFHSKLFHAAGRNLTDSTKYSMVFTYHEADNYPIAETRSSRFPSIRL